MNAQQERRARWQKWIDEPASNGLSRREFCQKHNLVLSQFSYYHLEFQKKKQKTLGHTDPSVLPIQLRPTPLASLKVVLPNGLQLSLLCPDTQQLKYWLGV
ncbi:MAG: hypothetical protein JSR33_05955 [Proteobacteria bacterium]|nr:hypothetical protein [Pseudomonadota bacterium]